MSNNFSDLVADDYPIAQIPNTPMCSENFAYNCNNADTGLSLIVLLGRWRADPTV